MRPVWVPMWVLGEQTAGAVLGVELAVPHLPVSSHAFLIRYLGFPDELKNLQARLDKRVSARTQREQEVFRMAGGGIFGLCEVVRQRLLVFCIRCRGPLGVDRNRKREAVRVLRQGVQRCEAIPHLNLQCVHQRNPAAATKDLLVHR